MAHMKEENRYITHITIKEERKERNYSPLLTKCCTKVFMQLDQINKNCLHVFISCNIFFLLSAMSDAAG